MVEEAVAVGGIYLEYDLIQSNKMGLVAFWLTTTHCVENFCLHWMRQTGRLSSGFDARPSPTHNLTVFPVEAHLPLVLLLALQGFVHLLDQALVGLGPVQEAAGAGLLHHLRPHEAGQLTEAVRTVDDGVVVATLGISQQEVAVCEEREGRKQGSRPKKCFLGCQSCELREKHTVLFYSYYSAHYLSMPQIDR